MADDIWMIEAIIQPFKLDAVTLALEELPEFPGMTVSDCRGFGQEKLAESEQSHAPASDAGLLRRRRGDSDFVDFTDKAKLEIAVAGRAAADVIAATIVAAAHTGRRGDGKVFMWPLSRVVRIRTSAEGASVV